MGTPPPLLYGLDHLQKMHPVELTLNQGYILFKMYKYFSTPNDS